MGFISGNFFAFICIILKCLFKYVKRNIDWILEIMCVLIVIFTLCIDLLFFTNKMIRYFYSLPHFVIFTVCLILLFSQSTLFCYFCIHKLCSQFDERLSNITWLCLGLVWPCFYCLSQKLFFLKLTEINCVTFLW